MWVSLANSGFPRYEVSECGAVRNKRTQYELKQWMNADGYMNVCPQRGVKDRKGILCLVHRLVLKAHEPNVEADTLTVDHIDRDRSNNNLTNLKWSDAADQATNRSLCKSLCSARTVEVFSNGLITKTFRTVTEATEEYKIFKFEDGMTVRQDAQLYILRYKREVEIVDEVWKTLAVNGNQICISNFGRRRHANGRISIGSKANGYLKTVIYDGKTTKPYYMHRLVALAFVEKMKSDDLVVNHIDSNRQNNRADNLEWVTMARNITESSMKGKLAKYKTRLCSYDKNGIITGVYASITDAKKTLGLKCDGYIHQIVREKKLYKNMSWEKVNTDSDIVLGALFTENMKRQQPCISTK